MCGAMLHVKNGTPDVVVGMHMDSECVAMCQSDEESQGYKRASSAPVRQHSDQNVRMQGQGAADMQSTKEKCEKKSGDVDVVSLLTSDSDSDDEPILHKLAGKKSSGVGGNYQGREVKVGNGQSADVSHNADRCYNLENETDGSGSDEYDDSCDDDQDCSSDVYDESCCSDDDEDRDGAGVAHSRKRANESSCGLHLRDKKRQMGSPGVIDNSWDKGLQCHDEVRAPARDHTGMHKRTENGVYVHVEIKHEHNFPQVPSSSSSSSSSSHGACTSAASNPASSLRDEVKNGQNDTYALSSSRHGARSSAAVKHEYPREGKGEAVLVNGEVYAPLHGDRLTYVRDRDVFDVSDGEDTGMYDLLPDPNMGEQRVVDVVGNVNAWSSDDDEPLVCADDVIDLDQEKQVAENEWYAEMQDIEGSDVPRGEGATIIYAPSRRLVESIASRLQQLGHVAEPYHARLDANHLRHVHAGFVRGEISVVVATVAFGMGINRADVRNVIHYGWPQSLEQYFQEAGRAGRDGKPANCVLFADLSMLPSLLPSKGRSFKQSKAACDALTALYKYAVRNCRCRQGQMLDYFGEVLGGERMVQCGECDVCCAPAVHKQDFTQETVALFKAIHKHHVGNAARTVRCTL
jgi:hypothetical protein